LEDQIETRNFKRSKTEKGSEIESFIEKLETKRKRERENGISTLIIGDIFSRKSDFYEKINLL